MLQQDQKDLASDEQASSSLSTLHPPCAPTPHTPLWRCLEELADTPQFRELVEREFPVQAAECSDPLTRRRFLTLMGAALTLAGLSGCGQAPREKIVPYVRDPEGVVPGRPLFYATAMTLDGVATGLLVEQHLGRPTKVEGNPDHPASQGATDAFAQAAVLGLYDPDRSAAVTHLGRISSWGAAVSALRAAAERQRPYKGAGLRLLTEPVSSPTLARQLEQFLKEYPEARWHQYEPVTRVNARKGAWLAFGEDLNAVYRLEQADAILALDADFLGSGPGHLRYARDFAARRRVWQTSPAEARMNRLYAVESSPSVTGIAADHRFPLRAVAVESFARALAARLGVPGFAETINDPGLEKWLAAVAQDLQQHRGRGLVIAGDAQPPAVHALAHTLNGALGNTGQTVVYTHPVLARPVDEMESLRELVQDMDSGRVETLVVLGGNPAFNAPADLDFATALTHLSKIKGAVTAHLGLYADETALLCQWHIPEAHFLEAWSDARAYDGTVTLLQPLIAPLHNGITAHEVLAVLLGRPSVSAYDLVREFWREQHAGQGAASAFEQFWEKALHDGVVEATAFSPQKVTLRENLADGIASGIQKAVAPPPSEAASAPHGSVPRENTVSDTTSGTTSGINQKVAPKAIRDTTRNSTRGADAIPLLATVAADRMLEIVFRPDPTVYDGRFANNAWLQELPKPLTRVTWDAVALVSPETAREYDLGREIGNDGGTLFTDVVELEYQGRRLEAPVWIMPGHADRSVTVYFGYGRTNGGRVGSKVGFNGYRLRASERPWFDGGLVLRKTGKRYTLACTQLHHLMHGRDLVRTATLDHYRQNPAFATKSGHGPHVRQPLLMAAEAEPPTLYPEYEYNRYKWGMVIDQSVCTGCQACVIACQAENNIPVVGKDEVARGRGMHWLRVDTYYAGDTPDQPANTYFQPVPCMHCEKAPCEVVCPVNATVHSDEGLNDMVYNRCVGTRYCSNNCPYKVRRFNYLLFQDWDTPSLKLGRNPDVTVRSRGVMEKCTYCVQRINEAKITAEKAMRRVRDGDIQTACQQACPTQAIVFGDLNDASSRVAKLQAEQRSYTMLADLNTRPRTAYMAVVRNVNPELGE